MKTGKVPKGIVTSQTVTEATEAINNSLPKSEKDFIKKIMSNDPRAVPKKPSNAKRFLFEQLTKSEAPRNVYLETVHTDDGETIEVLWWHCDNGNYVGRTELQRIDPKTEESYLVGYDYIIMATKDNLKKVISMATQRTNFYKKYQTETRAVSKDEFLS